MPLQQSNWLNQLQVAINSLPAPSHRQTRVVAQAQELQAWEASKHGGGEGAGEAVVLPVNLRMKEQCKDQYRCL